MAAEYLDPARAFFDLSEIVFSKLLELSEQTRSSGNEIPTHALKWAQNIFTQIERHLSNPNPQTQSEIYRSL